MARPNTPSSVHINNTSNDTGVITRNTDGSLPVSAVVNDPDGQKVRAVVRYSTDEKFGSQKTALSKFVTHGTRATANLSGLSLNTHYFVRVYAQSSGMQLSANYNAGDFWTDRFPSPPEMVSPQENASFDPAQPIIFDWKWADPDESASSHADGWNIQYRIAGTPLTPEGPWIGVLKRNVITTTWTMPANTLTQAMTYEWRVRTRDAQGQWGEWSLVRSFTTNGRTQTPLIVSPASDVAVYCDAPIVLRWLFRDPKPAATQGNADVRYRVVGGDDTTWVLIPGGALVDQEITVPPGTFAPGYHYEWQVQTYRSVGSDPLSSWSTSGFFWSLLTPGSLTELPGLDFERPQPALGVGTHRVFLFQQGGLYEMGEVHDISKVKWGRLRDGISAAEVTVDNYSEKTRQLLKVADVWAFELVIYRDDVRVWEGPIVHIADSPGKFIISCADVMGYVYRRVLRQGYNDGYHLVGGVQQGLKTVVDRAALITVNCLAYHDPNVLPYLTLIRTGNDARQSRIVPDYTRTAHEEIDDLAANAGLDYTVAGRRIIYWDTHQSIGRLPELTDGDFSEHPIVTTYGMSAANYFAVTDGQGNWGAAYPAGLNASNWMDRYGPLEQLASGYGDVPVDTVTLTPAAQAAMAALLGQQASRNINGRYPMPRIARVPDNATISPEVNIGINQLVPGVHVPLRVDGIVNPFRQMQKLDSLTVTQEDGIETISVVLAPAPASREIDPDSAGEDTDTEVP